MSEYRTEHYSCVAMISQWGRGVLAGVWERNPQVPDAIGGLEAKPPALGDFCNF